MTSAANADRSARQMVRDLILIAIAYVGCLVLRPVVLVADRACRVKLRLKRQT
jgi:hypothetical protein